MVTLLTPTRNRPVCFQLLEKWIAHQDFRESLQWIVVNDGQIPYDYTANQTVIIRKPKPGEIHSMCMNLLCGLDAVEGHALLIIEDDDYFAPAYISTMVKHLEKADMAGSAPAYYYNLASRTARTLPNQRHASLGQTGFRRELLRWLSSLARRGSPFIDLRAWRQPPKNSVLFENKDHRGMPLHLSMKGLPGEKGIGMGHRSTRGQHDADWNLLDSLIGCENAKLYKMIASA